MLSLLLLLPLALSSPLLPRQQDRISFPTSEETCIEDPTGRLHSTNLAGLPYVTVQPLCDNTISTLCALTTDPSAALPSRGLKATATNSQGTDAGACEAHLLFEASSLRPKDWNYESCIAKFQKITIECMLIGVGKHAFNGQQAGVLGVLYLPTGKDSSVANPRWRAANDDGSPGFMVGPPGWFGNVSVPDVRDRVPGYAPPVL